jgi:ParB family transcriptional regulator, chromosome partitioning protein
MANKDLVKRAFSVTANLPSQQPVQAEPTAAPTDTATELTQPLVRRMPAESSTATATATVAPRTGPGSMLAFMTEQSEVHKEVVQLRDRLADLEGAVVARPLDPQAIRSSRWANRDAAHFASPAFARLRDEIAAAGGNVQPIKVRQVSSAPGEGDALDAQSGKSSAARYEIVYGHRRHRACLELGLPVLALIQADMKDADLFVEMERENREREDLSAWEQGVMYVRALEQGLFPSAKQLAAAIDRDTGNIGRAMALAKLPAEVVRAFGSPLNLQFRWAAPLRDAHQRDPEGLLAAAREVAALTPSLKPAAVFLRLTSTPAQNAGSTGAGSVAAHTNEPAQAWKDAQGNDLATLTVDRKGRVTVSFHQAMDETRRRRLVKLLDAFLDKA